MDFGALALVVAAGLLGPLLAGPHRLRPPVVIGEMAAGLIIGTSGFGWVDPSDPVLAGFGAVGFALLMFVVGTHLPVRDGRLREALLPGAGMAATVLVLAAGAGAVLAPHLGLDGAVVVLLLTTSSAAVALPVLQSVGVADRAALCTIVWISVADVATVVALPVALATGSTARVLVGVGVVAAMGGGLYAAARLVGDRPFVDRWRRRSRDRGWALELRISLLALFACAWAAQRFGASVLIAGFAVGAAVALLGEPRRVADQLIGLGEGFLIPLFFVLLGAELDVRALVHSPDARLIAVTLGLVSVAIHALTGRLWGLVWGYGLVASAQLGVPAAVVSIGLATDQLDPAQGAAVMASVLVTLAAAAIGGMVLGLAPSLTDASAPQVRPDTT